MSRPVSPDEGPLRMQFELARDDDPGLYDDLVRFKKGTKRINRLRFLAHEGMVAQALALGFPAGRVAAAQAGPLGAAPGGHDAGPRIPAAVLGTFDAAVGDE